MGLFSRFDPLHRWKRHSRPVATPPRTAPLRLRPRVCRFEQMEPRLFLSAAPVQAPPIHIGMVYFEEGGNGADTTGDVFTLTFNGGAPGTELKHLVLNTDQGQVGSVHYGPVFNTAPGGPGVGTPLAPTIDKITGSGSAQVHVDNGSQLLSIDFTGFHAGDILQFRVDVDDRKPNGKIDALVDGAEMEDSLLTATFSAAHYADATASGTFLDAYDSELNGTGLPLPPDSYVPPETVDSSIYTAGVAFPLQQQSLPITLSGTVFEDMNGNNVQDPGDPGIPGVHLTIYTLSGSQYVASGFTAVTDANGKYEFDNVPPLYLLPGTYRVVETQPDGYLSIGARAGTVDGQTRGVVTDANTISDITLEGGDNSIHNDFAEARPASLSGYVYVDDNMNGVKDAGEAPIPGVTLTLLDSNGNPTATTTTTNGNGYYSFTGLKPGVYGVSEVQPAGYFDGLDSAGTAGGTAHNPGDSITGAVLLSGTQGLNYDFGELRPASLSGYVYADDNMNGVKDDGEALIAGVKLTLLDSNGNPTATTTTTDANGYYVFAGLHPGTYGVSETPLAGYFDGLASAGSAGGTAHNPGDSITGAALGSGTVATDYDFGVIRPAQIAGHVYVDLNNNGVFDPGETPVAGVTVYLLDASGNRIATTTTGPDGSYLFAQREPGTYGVEKVPPAGYLDGQATPGTMGGVADGADRIDEVKLDPGTDAEKYDFGELLAAKLSGYVFVDLPAVTYQQGTQPPDQIELLKTHDGVLRPEDQRLSGVVLHLGDANGVPVLDAQGREMTTVTNADGYYEFDNLPPGVYTIIEEHPAGYIDGVNTPGTAGGEALNALTISENPAITAELAFDTSNEAIIRITLGMGAAGQNYNFSELVLQPTPAQQTQGFAPPPPPAPSPPSFPPTPALWGELPAAVALPRPGEAGPDSLPGWGGGGVEEDYTWHLSVIDGGRPREDREKTDLTAGLDDVSYSAVSWNGSDLNSGQWILADAEGNPMLTEVFGMPGAIPVTGDWNGDGTTKIGVFSDGNWFLDLNGDGHWDKDDLWAKLGHAGDVPITGDWDGDGKTDIGIFGPAWRGDRRAILNELGLPDVDNRMVAWSHFRYKNIPPDPDQATSGGRILKRTALGKFRKDLIDHVFQYGDERSIPVTGDWNGDGVTNIGIFYNGKWYLDVNGDGRWSAGDVVIKLGQSGDIPVVGDWNGDGRAKLGVYRRGTWLLDTNGDGVLDARDRVFHLGEPGDVPVVGDWNGDGIDKIGVYRPGAKAPAKQASAQASPTPASSSAAPAIKR